MVPEVRIELTTYRLQGGCSTTELHRQHELHWVVRSDLASLDVSPNIGARNDESSVQIPGVTRYPHAALLS